MDNSAELLVEHKQQQQHSGKFHLAKNGRLKAAKAMEKAVGTIVNVAAERFQ